MQLLNLKTVRNKKIKSDELIVSHLIKLREEEIKLIKSLNLKKEFTELEIKKLNEKLSDYRKYILENIDSLSQKVRLLERKRINALKPIKQLKLEVENKLKKIIDREKEIKTKEKEVEENRILLIQRMEKLSDKLQEVKEIEKENDKVILKIKKQQKITSKLSNKLTKLWSEYYIKVNKSNVEFKKRENNILNEKQVNIDYKNTLIKEKEELANYKIQLLDERETLNQAWSELKRKQQKYDDKCKKR